MSGHTTEAGRLKRPLHPLFWVVAPFVLLMVVIVLVIGLYVVSHYLNEIKMDRQREAIGSFVAPTGWEEIASPSASGAFGDSFCMLPALFCNWHQVRTWWTAEPQTRATLRAVAEGAGWKEIRFVSKRKGQVCEAEGESTYSCPLHAESDKASFELQAWPDNNDERRWRVRVRAY